MSSLRPSLVSDNTTGADPHADIADSANAATYPDEHGGYTPFPEGAAEELNAFCDYVDSLRAASEDLAGDEARNEAAADLTPAQAASTLAQYPEIRASGPLFVAACFSVEDGVITACCWQVFAGACKGQSRTSLADAVARCIQCIGDDRAVRQRSA